MHGKFALRRRLLGGVVEAVYGVYAVVSFFVLVLICLGMLLLPISVTARRQVAHLMSRLTFIVIGTRLIVHGLRDLPTGPCVVVVNHASYLDGVVLKAVLPARFTFVMKKEARRIPFGGLLLQRIGSEFIDRFNRQAAARGMRRLIRAAENGRPLVFFPEGTFVTEPGVGKFHKGAFVIAAHTAVPVVPIALQGTRGMLPSGRMLPRPGRISVTILPALEPRLAAGAPHTVASLRDEARARIIAALGEPDLAGSEHSRTALA